MKQAARRNWGRALALGLVGTACNSLLDIEPHALVPLEADASVSHVSHETVSGAAPSLEPSANTGGDRPDASVATAHESTTESTAGTLEPSPALTSGIGATFELTGETGNSGGSAEPASDTSSSPPTDPRDVTPAPPNLDASVGCANKLDTWGHTTFCRITPNGFNREGEPLPDVGDIHLWVYWSATSVAGWICVIDDTDNGRGIQYRVLVHPEGAELPGLPANDVTPSGAWVAVYEGRDDDQKPGQCAWVEFGAPQAVDQVLIEWLDLWTTRAFGGRFSVPAP